MTHSTSVLERRGGVDRALPVTIGDDCWIGGHATILPGCVIGDGALFCPLPFPLLDYFGFFPSPLSRTHLTLTDYVTLTGCTVAAGAVVRPLPLPHLFFSFLPPSSTPDLPLSPFSPPTSSHHSAKAPTPPSPSSAVSPRASCARSNPHHRWENQEGSSIRRIRSWLCRCRGWRGGMRGRERGRGRSGRRGMRGRGRRMVG